MNGIFGRAATGLQDSSWAVNENVAKIGAKGEQKTEALLNGFGKKAAVLHDLRIPIPGFKANIDHAIVSGKSVLLIDSNMWKPGFYWSTLGYRRGWEKTPHIDKSQEYVATRATSCHRPGSRAQQATGDQRKQLGNDPLNLGIP